MTMYTSQNRHLAKLDSHHSEADASRCVSSGDGLLTSLVDKDAKFIVNTVEAGPGELNVTIEGESGVLQPKINPISETLIEVTYKPTRSGEHTIVVSWCGKDIPGSPFTVHAHLIHPSDPRIFKVENPVSESLLGVPVEFVVHGQEETRPGELTIVAVNSQGKALPGDVERCDERTYNCIFHLPVKGKYVVHAYQMEWRRHKGNPLQIKGFSFS